MRKTILRLAFGAAMAAWAAGPVAAQSWQTVTSARQVFDTSPLTVEVRYGAGTLNVGPAEAPALYRMEIRYDAEHFEPVVEFDADDRTLELGVEGLDGRHHDIDVHDGSSATIELTRQVPIDLDLEFGAGEADIELGGIALRALELSTGASDTDVQFSTPNPQTAERVSIEAGAADLRVIGLGNANAREIRFQGGVGATVLDFSGALRGDVAASVEMGVGSVTLRLPRAYGVRLERDSFLTTFEAPGLERRGESYYSANWGSTQHQLSIDVSAAFGSIEIEWVD